MATVEDEWGPGQVKLTFEPMIGTAAADAAILVRSALKQISRRHGYHATFMAGPALANAFSSGWHLHQSLSSSDSQAVRTSCCRNRYALRGRTLGARPGLLGSDDTNHQRLQAIRPDSFATDRVAWAEENRGALIRVAGARGDSSTHLENRIGEPAANPYLYLASQIAIARQPSRRRFRRSSRAACSARSSGRRSSTT